MQNSHQENRGRRQGDALLSKVSEVRFLFGSRGKKTVKTIAIIVALCAAGLIVAQSDIPLGARLKLHWKGSTVYLREGATEHELDVRDQFHAVRLDKVVLQSAKDAGGFIYLLLDVTGPSKLPQDSHQCGARLRIRSDLAQTQHGLEGPEYQ
jgi:hypothetical protein